MIHGAIIIGAIAGFMLVAAGVGALIRYYDNQPFEHDSVQLSADEMADAELEVLRQRAKPIDPAD